MRREIVCAVALWAVANCIAVPAQIKSFGVFIGGQYTRPSPGLFPAANLHIQQKMPATGPSRVAEFCRDIGSNIGCLQYIVTPTESTLMTPTGSVAWPVADNNFNLTLHFPLRPLAGMRFLPWLTLGAGAIALNGGKTSRDQPGAIGSGWNGQGDILAGAGFDRRLRPSLGLRLDVAIIGLKQSGFSDVTYRSAYTAKVQIALGTVYYWGTPRRPLIR